MARAGFSNNDMELYTLDGLVSVAVFIHHWSNKRGFIIVDMTSKEVISSKEFELCTIGFLTLVYFRVYRYKKKHMFIWFSFSYS